jgi:hypothetical protein
MYYPQQSSYKSCPDVSYGKCSYMYHPSLGLRATLYLSGGQVVVDVSLALLLLRLAASGPACNCKNPNVSAGFGL